MLITHLEKRPVVDPSAYIAPNATICGDVTIGAGCRIMFGACVVSEGAPVKIGENSIVMENAVLRATDHHPLTIGAHCLVGPHAHLVGCSLEACVFVATGASVFHGAKLLYNSEVRVNAVVHLRTTLAAHAIVPIGWVAVGNPAQLFPPDQHEEIWKVQKPLDFPGFVYGIERAPSGQSNMPEITTKRSSVLGTHKGDMAADADE